MKSIEKTLEGLAYLLRCFEAETEAKVKYRVDLQNEIQTLQSAIYHIEHFNTFVDGDEKIIKN